MGDKDKKPGAAPAPLGDDQHDAGKQPGKAAPASATDLAPLADVYFVPSFDWHGGGSTTSHVEGGSLVLDAPKVTFAAHIELVGGSMSSDNIGSLRAGPVQNLTSSERIAVYKRPDGSRIETRSKMGQMRDAKWQPNTPTKDDPDKFKAYGSVGDFYQDPVSLGGALTTATAKFDDQPGFGAGLTYTSGADTATLVETRGHDSFITSLLVKRTNDGASIQSNQRTWSVSWNSTVDQEKTSGLEKMKPAEKTTDQAKVDPKGQIPMNVPGYVGFPSLPDAMKATPSQLLETLPIAKDKDPQSYGFAIEAIRAKNFKVNIALNCVNCYSYVGKDSISVKLKGIGGSHDASFKMASGDALGTAAVPFLELFPDSATWGGSNHLTIDVAATDSISTVAFNQISLIAPFQRGMTEVPGSKGRYQLSVTMA